MIDRQSGALDEFVSAHGVVSDCFQQFYILPVCFVLDRRRHRLGEGRTGIAGRLCGDGLIEGAECRPLATPEFAIGSDSVGVVDNVCTQGRGEFYVEGLLG